MCQAIILLLLSFSIQNIQAAHAEIKTKQAHAQEYERGTTQKARLPEHWNIDRRHSGAINNDGVAALVAEGGIVIHDLRSGLLNSFEFIDLKDKVAGTIRACAISDDGVRVAFADDQGNFGLVQGKDIRLSGQKVDIERMLFDRDGNRLIALVVTRGTGVTRYHAHLVMYDMDFKELARVDLREATWKRPNITDLAINDTGVAVVWSRKVKLWSIAENKLTQLSSDNVKCSSVLFTRDGRDISFLGIEHKLLNAYVYLQDYQETRKPMGDIAVPLATNLKYARLKLIDGGVSIVIPGAEEQFISKSLDNHTWWRYKHLQTDGPFIVGNGLIVSYQLSTKSEANTCSYSWYSQKPLFQGSTLSKTTLKVPARPFQAKKNYRKRVLQSVACVVVVIGAYAAWRKLKKKERVTSVVDLLKQRRITA